MKSKMVRVISVLIMILQVSTAYASNKNTILEIRAQVPERWQGVYQAKGREIRVDIPIEVPDVSMVPIFTSEFPQSSIVDSSVPAHYEQLEHTFEFSFRNDQYLFGIGVNSPFIPIKGKGKEKCPEEYLNIEDIDMNASYAENNTMSVQEAWNIFRQEYERCYGAGSADDLFLNHIVLRGVLREYNSKTKEYGEALRDQGGYVFSCYQRFYGIPVLTGAGSTFVGKSQKGEGNAFVPVLEGAIASDDAFDLMFMRGIVDEKIHDDVPLCSFGEIIPVFEKYIEDGYIRNVYSCRLGYVQFLESSTSKKLWNVPCWVIECEYYSSAKDEPDAKFESEALYKTVPSYNRIIINAQTGQILDPMNKSKTRSFCPPINTW